MRILIVDDDERVQDALSLYLDTYDEFVVVGKAGDGAEAVRLCEQLRPDLVLMDLNMPVMDGVKATRRICERFPHIPIVILTSSWDTIQIEAAWQAGAIACVLKGTQLDQLAWTINQAHKQLRLRLFYLDHNVIAAEHNDWVG